MQYWEISIRNVKVISDACPCHRWLLLEVKHCYVVGKSLSYYRDASPKVRRFCVPHSCCPYVKSKVWLVSVSFPTLFSTTFALPFTSLLSEDSHANPSRWRSSADLLFCWESPGMFCEVIFIWRNHLDSNSWLEWYEHLHAVVVSTWTSLHTVFWKEIGDLVSIFLKE